MSDEFPLQPGDTGTVAMLSPCVGGLVRTWIDSGFGTDLQHPRCPQQRTP